MYVYVYIYIQTKSFQATWVALSASGMVDLYQLSAECRPSSDPPGQSLWQVYWNIPKQMGLLYIYIYILFLNVNIKIDLHTYLIWSWYMLMYLNIFAYRSWSSKWHGFYFACSVMGHSVDMIWMPLLHWCHICQTMFALSSKDRTQLEMCTCVSYTRWLIPRILSRLYPWVLLVGEVESIHLLLGLLLAYLLSVGRATK